MKGGRETLRGDEPVWKKNVNTKGLEKKNFLLPATPLAFFPSSSFTGAEVLNLFGAICITAEASGIRFYKHILLVWWTFFP